jgi:hypothetical protein
MLSPACVIVIGALFILCVVLSVMLRGALINNDAENLSSIQTLTGKEIESFRRKLVMIPSRTLSREECFSLILTIREIQLGRYVDKDPWIPPDIYSDIEDDDIDQ